MDSNVHHQSVDFKGSQPYPTETPTTRSYEEEQRSDQMHGKNQRRQPMVFDLNDFPKEKEQSSYVTDYQDLGLNLSLNNDVEMKGGKALRPPIT